MESHNPCQKKYFLCNLSYIVIHGNRKSEIFHYYIYFFRGNLSAKTLMVDTKYRTVFKLHPHNGWPIFVDGISKCILQQKHFVVDYVNFAAVCSKGLVNNKSTLAQVMGCHLNPKHMWPSPVTNIWVTRLQWVYRSTTESVSLAVWTSKVDERKAIALHHSLVSHATGDLLRIVIPNYIHSVIDLEICPGLVYI